MPETEKKNVYISLHRNFVRENIEYTDRATGETRTFNQARLPEGTVIDGRDMGGYEFSPLFVNESRFRGEEWRDIPLLADREVWLQRSVMDPEGNPVVGEDGRRMKDIVKVMPAQIKEAIAESRRAWAEAHADDGAKLADRAREVRSVSEAIEQGTAHPRAVDAR
jgi:hypothetical protein